MTARVRHRRVFEGAALDIRYDGNRARRPAVARFELGPAEAPGLLGLNGSEKEENSK